MASVEQQGNCEGSYKSCRDGKIYQYQADFRGGQSITWKASIKWAEREALTCDGTISHNILCGRSLQELVRAHVVAAIQSALDDPRLTPATQPPPAVAPINGAASAP